MILYTNKYKGFTLIELLVVIAIIGFLSSIVLAALNSSRDKSNDAAIKNNLNSARSQSELYYSTNKNYISSAPPGTTTLIASGACGTGSGTINGIYADNQVKAALAAALAKSGNSSSAFCIAYPEYWSVSIPLKTDPNTSWCISSNARSKSIATPAGYASFPGCF